MGKKFNSIIETIGRTPVVKLNRLAPEGVNVFVKVESFNPGGSIKDRLALGVIEDAERRGLLKPGQTVVEATSGNTGIGLALVCAQKGYPLVVVMAESFSIERRKMMRFMGAKVVLTPASEKGTGMLNKAIELAETHGWFLCNQFINEANADMHSRTTAPEILEAFAGERLDYWVTGFGTGGTLKGVGRVLAKESPETKIIVCEPDNSALLASGIPQARKEDGSVAYSHPNFRPHLMQGWTPDFIPKLCEDAVDAGFISEIKLIHGYDAVRLSQELAQKEGIFVGITGGATLAGALQIAEKAEPGSNILCMLPDTGERYLSTPLFLDISVNMTPEEEEISKSTPNYRFDKPSAPPPATTDEVVPVTEEATTFVETVVNDKELPVVMFALEWCEFSWSVRKLFGASNVAYRSVDLDSAKYQKDNEGGKIRAALNARTGIVTIPQIFVGGELIGGCTEVLNAYNEGRLQEKFRDLGISFTQVEGDAYQYFPGWLQKR